MTRYRCAKIEVKIDKRHQMLLILYSARVKIDAGMAANKELPREPTVPPRSGFVGTFLLAG